jgi:hypothetical protein
MMTLFDWLKKTISKRKAAYRAVFSGPQADIVLADLARTCRYFDSTFDPNPSVMAFLEGRRDVFMRIRQHLELTEEELIARVMTVQRIEQEEASHVVH